MKFLSGLSKILLIIGGLNWGLIGLFNFNLVTALFGVGSTATHIVYDLIGLAAVLAIFCCGSSGSCSTNKCR